MREIEIKVRLRDRQKVIGLLKTKGVDLKPAVKQHDVVYSLPGAADNALDANWLRIRTENDQKVIFTLKRSVVGHLDSIEHEVVVDDAAELEQIIKLMGYELYSDLTKTRQKAKLGDIEICIDTVDGLGDFMEAEKMMHEQADHDEVVDELWSVFVSLGIDKSDEETLGYDVLERARRLNS